MRLPEVFGKRILLDAEFVCRNLISFLAFSLWASYSMPA